MHSHRLVPCKHARLRLMLFSFALLLGASNLSAETLTRVNSLSIEEVLTATLAGSPEVKLLDATLASRMGEALSTRVIPNPHIETDLRFPKDNFVSKEDTEVEVSLEQPFRISHFGLRQAVAELMVKAGEADQKIALLELSQKVRLLYVRRWALEAQKVVADSARQRALAAASVISESSKKGLLPLSDSKLFESEAKRLVADSFGLESAIKRAEAELVRLSGLELSGRSFARPEIPSKLQVAQLIQRAERGEIAVQLRAKLLSELANEQRRLAERDSYPLLAPRLLYQHSSDGLDQYGVGIRIEVPLFDHNQAEKTKRWAEEQATSAEQQYLLGDAFKSQLSLLAESLNSSASQVEIYEEQVLPALEQAFKSANRQLQAGQGSVMQLFQIQKEMSEAGNKAVELWVQAFANQAELSVLLGSDL